MNTDAFKSAVVHYDAEGLAAPDLIPYAVSEIADGDLMFCPNEYGWTDGGLARACGNVVNRGPFYFRGHALFDNPDDAKNDYLIEPEPTHHYDESDGAPCVEHVPWGMAIPHWSQRAGDASPHGLILVGATVIIFWQELS